MNLLRKYMNDYCRADAQRIALIESDQLHGIVARPGPTVRNKYAIPAPEEAKLDPNILTLGQATKYCGVSDTTLKRLIHENILAVAQVAPYAPLQINRADLDSEPVASILERLKATGKLILEGDTLRVQRCLFESHQ